MFRIIGFIVGCSITATALWLLIVPAPWPPLLHPAITPAAPLAAAEVAATASEPDTQPQPAVTQEAERTPLQRPPVTMPDPAVPHRQLFWSPFRSERVAKGFASGISERSAVEVTTVRIAALHYQLAFDYRDESQRAARMRQIEEATGLDLSQWRQP